jgi:hypothetical protein
VSLSRPVVDYKLRAALASLVVFLVFALALGYITYRFWYPGYLFWTDGGMQGLRIVLSVDFVLGPVLALVFFHPEKSRPKLVFDIVVIAAIQLAAMVWGTHQVYSQRPVAVVYGSQRFISVAPAIMDLQYRTPESLRQYSADRPPYVFRRPPRDEAEKRRMMSMLMGSGFHFEAQAWLFEPFLPHIAEVFERQRGKHEHIRKFMAASWRQWVAGRERQRLADYRFAFFEGRFRNALLIFTPEGRFLDYIGMGDEPLPDIMSDAELDAEKKAGAGTNAPVSR